MLNRSSPHARRSIGLLWRAYGSAFPRTLPAALATFIFTFSLMYFKQEEVATWWANPTPYQHFTFAGKQGAWAHEARGSPYATHLLLCCSACCKAPLASAPAAPS